MATDWDGDEPRTVHPFDPDSGPVNRLEASAGSSWPATLGGYVKLILTAIAGLGTTGVLEWLQAAGVTSLPAWAIAGITLVVSLGTLLFSPKNKT